MILLSVRWFSNVIVIWFNDYALKWLREMILLSVRWFSNVIVIWFNDYSVSSKCGSDQVGGSFNLQSSLFKSQKKSKKVKKSQKKSFKVKTCQKVNFKCHMFVFELVVWWIIFKISANLILKDDLTWNDCFFILVKFWFIDDIIIWFPGERGGQDMQIIKWLFTWKIMWFGCIVSLGMLSLAQVKWIKCHHLDLWSYDNGVRVRAETTELEMARGKISARPSESYGEHHLLRTTKNKKSSGCFFLKVVGHKKLKSWRLFPLDR